MKKKLQGLISILLIVITVGVVIFHTGSMHAKPSSAKTASSAKTSETKTAKKMTKKEQELASLPKGVKPTDWDLLLVSGQSPLPAGYKPDLTTIGHFKINKKVKPHYEALAAAAKKAGYELTIVSSYRSVEYQKQIYNQHIKDDMAQGKSEKEAEKDTADYMTKPGTSEHHTGMALDVLTTSYVKDHGNDLSAAFGDTAGGKWLAQNCAQYGFIIRYPKDKYDITKIKYEPWHIRYVGKENAEYIMSHHLSLEEYDQLLKERDSQK